MTKPNVFTAVYRDITPDECGEITSHPKWSAGSWSHALDDRDAARSALASSDAQADGGKGEAVYQARWVGEVKWRDVTHDEFVTAQKGLLSEDREFRVLFTAPQAECAPRKPLKALYEVLMRRNIECGSEAYLTLRCVGVLPSKKEFVRAIEQAAKEKK